MNSQSSSAASGDDTPHMTIARDAIREGLRSERLFRYHYQLSHQREAPPLDGLLWREVDRIVAQSKLSDQVLSQRLDSKAALQEVIGRMELLYDTTWTEAQEKCSAAWLAEAGLPIWNQAIQALLPPTLGDLQLWARAVPSDQRLGHRYSYRASDKPAFAEIYVYDMGHSHLLPGTVDDRVLEEFARSRRDVPSEFEDENKWQNYFSETEFDFIEDSESLHRQRMISRSWCSLSGTETLDVGKAYSLCLTVFNGAFIKVVLRWPLKYFLSMSDEVKFTLDARMSAALGEFFREYAK